MKTSRMIKEIAACDGKARNEMEWQRPEARENNAFKQRAFLVLNNRWRNKSNWDFFLHQI